MAKGNILVDPNDGCKKLKKHAFSKVDELWKDKKCLKKSEENVLSNSKLYLTWDSQK